MRFCGSRDTVVLAEFRDQPFNWDVLRRRCRRVFGWDTNDGRGIGTSTLSYDPLEVELALKGRWNTKIYEVELIPRLKLVGEEDWSSKIHSSQPR